MLNVELNNIERAQRRSRQRMVHQKQWLLLGSLVALITVLSACSSTMQQGLDPHLCQAASTTHSTPQCIQDPTKTAGASTATTPTASTTGTPSATVQPGVQPNGQPAVPYSDLANQRIVDMLTNIEHNGYNPQTGELYINWRYGTQPFQTNLSGSGVPDTTRKDPLTDLRYLHNLVHYKKLHPQDTTFDAEITKWTAIVKGEFAGTKNARGWVFDELVALGRLSGDNWFMQQAQGLAADYAAHYNAKVGTLVFADTPTGYMRVDWGIEQGGALVQAGVAFNMPQWVTIGEATLAYIRSHAYVPQYHAYIHIITDMVLPAGSANPSPTIFRAPGVNGGNIKMGEVAQEIISLLHAASASGDSATLSMATDLLDNFSADTNTLKLWDTQNLGYFAQASFTGPDTQHPGAPTVQVSKKEQGRQIQMLEAYVAANHMLGNKYASMQQQMEHVVEGLAYNTAAHGIGYECHPDWTLYHLNNGTMEDWVTTEAMGIGLEGLLAMEDVH